MKVCIVSPYAFPETGAASTRVQSMAEYFSKKGAITTIIAQSKAGIEPNPLEAIPVFRFSSHLDLVQQLVRQKPDLIISSTPPALLTFYCWMAAKWSGSKLIADIRDPWVLDKEAVGLIQRKSTKFWVQKQLERFSYSASDARFVVTRRTAGVLSKFLGTPADAFELAPNGFDPKKFYFSPKDRLLERKRLRIPKNGKVFAFEGGGYRKPWTFLEWLEGDFVKKNQLFFLFLLNVDVSKKSPKPLIEEIAGRRGFSKNVLVFENVPGDRVGPLLNAADVGLNFLFEGLHYSVPVKTFEYAACGLPTICLGPTEGALKDLVLEKNIGWYLSDSTAWVSTFKKMVLDWKQTKSRYKTLPILAPKLFSREIANETVWKKASMLVREKNA